MLLACASAELDSPPDESPPEDSLPETLPGDSDRDSSSGGVASDLVAEVDPDIQSLLRLSWTQLVAGETRVEWELDGAWVAAPGGHREAGPQEELVLGLPYETGTRLRVLVDEAPSAEIAASTGPLPEGFPLPTLLVDEPSLQEPGGVWLLGSINQDQGGWDEGRYWMFILDRQARVVWARRGEERDFTIYLHVSKDGDILWDVSTWWSDFDHGEGSKIHRMKIDGVVTETYEAPGMHHCFTELPDGSLIWGSGNDQSETLERRWPDGSVSTVWDCAPFYAELGLHDWCHTNSIYYDEDRASILLSFPTSQTFALELDAASGEPLRQFGHIPGSWAFDPEDSAFQYQHGASFTDAGTLLVSTQQSERSIVGMVREYELDDDAQTLRQTWSFGEEQGILQQYAGEAHRLPNGNTLHNFGTSPRVQENTPDGELAWDVDFGGTRLIGRTVFLEDLYQLAP